MALKSENPLWVMLSGETLVGVLGFCHNVWQWYSVGRQYGQWLTIREDMGQVDCDCNLLPLKESVPLCEIQLTPKGQHKAFSRVAMIQSSSTILPLHRSTPRGCQFWQTNHRGETVQTCPLQHSWVTAISGLSCTGDLKLVDPCETRVSDVAIAPEFFVSQ